MKRRLAPIVEQTSKLHAELAALWENLPGPTTRRGLVVLGYCSIVRQHVFGQFVLAQNGLDVPATTLVRPAFESLVRAIWCARAADEEWIQKFLTPSAGALLSDAETEMGPSVQRMLDQIEAKDAGHVHQSLVELKLTTWRAMHSYVHGGIRPVVQSLSDLPEHEVSGVLVNANLMFVLATNLVRMNSGVSSPQLADIQLRYVSCLAAACRKKGSDSSTVKGK